MPEARPDFADVYRAHFAYVWRTLRRLGLREAALDDAAQDVFLVVHQQLGAFEGRSTLKTWLFGIVLNTARHHRRSLARRGPHDPLPEALADPHPRGAVDAVAQSQAARVLHAFLDGLDEAHREVFVLAELEEMTAPEVAAATGANVNTVYSRLRTARRDFEAVVARQRALDAWRTP